MLSFTGSYLPAYAVDALPVRPLFSVELLASSEGAAAVIMLLLMPVLISLLLLVLEMSSLPPRQPKNCSHLCC